MVCGECPMRFHDHDWFWDDEEHDLVWGTEIRCRVNGKSIDDPGEKCDCRSKTSKGRTR